ncbi:MAG: hypothetical protein JWQ53_2773 [Klenkia sp.]|nr:hypothetical protein [Klenkia sp.]
MSSTGAGGAPVVWHVSEAMGGGITTAVNAFVESTPEYDHQLWCVERPAHRTGESGRFSAVHTATGSGPRALWRLLHEARAEEPPSVVHLHSSWAGLAGRRVLADWSSRIVYSPHCYWFERTDMSAPLLRVAEAIERRLAPRTRVTVAVSPHEARLARELGSPTAFVPNVAELPPGLAPIAAYDFGTGGRRTAARLPRDTGRPVTLVTVGRVEAQKDPRFFAQTVDEVRATGMAVRAVWVGGGDPALEAVLHRSGVETTGWVDRATALEHVVRADVYVHTAAWEGNPLTVLEAMVLQKPIAVRSIPSMTSLGHDPANTTPQALAATIRAAAAGVDTRPTTPRLDPQDTAVPLASVYDRVSGRVARHGVRAVTEA